MKRFAFCLAALLLPLSSLAQRNVEAEHACFASRSHADARSCLQGLAEKSRYELRAAQAALAVALQRRDEDAAEKARAQATYAASAARFAQLRASECEFQAVLAAGGNGAGDRRLLCEIELNQRRMRDLKATAASLR